VPTTLVGLYGYGSKDFLVAAHGTAADGKRNLEYVWDGTASNNPTTRFTQVAKITANGTTTWEMVADLSLWADKIADGSVKRAEIAVMPTLKNAAGTILAINAPSKTFDLKTNAFDSVYFKDIVKVSGGCNTCHDALATSFHSADRGGNIKVCRICHEVGSGGSHLEVQSRSIDSYVHAIHSFQAFDPGDIDFGDPVESLEYEHKTSSTFPTFGILNCESCHNKGMFEVPDQAKSMPGVLSGTDTVEGRSIGVILPSVTGPAVRACGACHRAQKINADDAGGLSILNQHFRTFGYMIERANETSAQIRTYWESVVAKIMPMFN
jgi:OmcA/MtrC family decaheme c-type cytochrome